MIMRIPIEKETISHQECLETLYVKLKPSLLSRLMMTITQALCDHTPQLIRSELRKSSVATHAGTSLEYQYLTLRPNQQYWACIYCGKRSNG